MKYREFEALKNSEKPVLIDFYADWCGPCKVLSPIIKEVGEYYQDAIKVIKINVDNEMKIANRENIMSVPTIMVFKEGKVIWRVAGVRSKRDIQKVIDKSLGISKQSTRKKRFNFFDLFLKRKNDE
ncbi:MAG: thioredoxin [Brumimicrobium sp.]